MPIEILPKRIYVTTHINTGRGLIKVRDTSHTVVII